MTTAVISSILSSIAAAEDIEASRKNILDDVRDLMEELYIGESFQGIDNTYINS